MNFNLMLERILLDQINYDFMAYGLEPNQCLLDKLITLAKLNGHELIKADTYYTILEDGK